MPHALKTFESTQQQFSQAELVGPPSRDQLLQRLFPPYDYAQIKEQGLDSIFYHDPVTGDDGLLHTFAGDIVRDSKGKLRSRGLHHEGASLAIWGRQPEGGSEPALPFARVSRVDIEAGAQQSPFEPYAARVAIGGVAKKGRTTMFPEEYDPFLVLQAVNTAFRNLDPLSAEKSIYHNRSVTSIKGQAVKIDGKTPMTVRMVIDDATGKIITAHPIIESHKRMDLTPEDVDSIVYGKPRARV